MTIDHPALLVFILLSLVISVGAVVVTGLVLGAMLRECQRLTRLVAGLVLQETAKLRGGR